MQVPDWLRIFPDADFRFRMGVRPGDLASFFEPDETLIKLRRSALDEHPERYAATMPGSEAAVVEAAGEMGVAVEEGAESCWELCLDLGRRVSADWVLLSPSAADHHPVIAGVVCFPSSWSLPEKLGQPIETVHAPVPTLDEGLNPSIHTFLDRLAPGVPWERDNWGLGADVALDHHPDVARPSLGSDARLATTWLRLERQLLLRVPKTGAILFGIRVSTHRLDALAAVPGLAPRMARAFRTMPEAVAGYKGMTDSRASLADALERT